jgi:phthalate 4,5-cis-dihydrodiol dehydrogenase
MKRLLPQTANNSITIPACHRAAVMDTPPLRIGVAGLSRAFALMAPTFTLDPRVALVAAADPREAARAKFESAVGGRAYASVDALCADADVDVVYVATPHALHAAHAIAAARAGKHVLVEKPMAVTLDDAQAMIAEAREAGVALIVGHSHSFDAPILHARKLIESGAFGRARMIHALNYTDFLFRPRRPEELATAQGGGVVFSQGAHQIDVVRLLGGGRVAGVRAATGAWDPERPTEGAYSALLTFDDGLFASVTYSGYAHFDSDEFCGWASELGGRTDADRYGAARRALRSGGASEAAMKLARAYGGANDAGAPPASATHQHFGVVVVSCDRADLRPTPSGVMIYGDDARRLDALPAPAIPRVEVIDELVEAVRNGLPPRHGGEWALATLEVCIAILESSRERRDVELRHQVALPR